MKEMKYTKLAKPSSQLQSKSQRKESSQSQNSYQIKINPVKSNYYSTSNSFRKAKFKSGKPSPEKSKSNQYLNIIQSQSKEDEIITECKKLEDHALDFIKKKFMNKKHTQAQSNYLNFTNPLYKANKIVINKKDLKISSQCSKLNQLNSNSESINTSITRMNCTNNPMQIEKDTIRDIGIVSNRDESGCINQNAIVNNKSNMFCASGRITVLKGKSNDTSDVNCSNNKNISGNINSSIVINNNSYLSKGFGYYAQKSNQKRISYTAINSRKNSNEKKITKLISHVSNKQFQYSKTNTTSSNINANGNGNANGNNASSKSKEKQYHIKSSISSFSSSNFKNNIQSNKLTKKSNHNKGSKPISVSNSKTNLETKICVEIARSKEKKQLTNSNLDIKGCYGNNYTSSNSPSHYLININKNDRICIKTTNSNKDNTHNNNNLNPSSKEGDRQSTKKSLSLSNSHSNAIKKHIPNINNLNKILLIFKQEPPHSKDTLPKNNFNYNNKDNVIQSNQISNNNNNSEKHKRNCTNHINNYFNNPTNSSRMSTMRDSNYYLHESEKLKSYIKSYYITNREYPKTNLNFYKIGRIIGRGAFGKVNLGLNILTGRVVAIKSFNKQGLADEISKKKILYETNIMRTLRHPSITKILETFETDKYMLIIMEYISGGNLQSFVKKRRKLIEKTAKILFKQIIEGIRYMHSQGIVHRDIKLENVLIDLNNNVKICDFGVGKIITPNTILRDQCGTPVYMAPEIIKNKGYEGFPVDIWSSGVALYIMLSGNVPFNRGQKNDLDHAIINMQPLPIEGISTKADDLIQRLLNKNPTERPTAEEVLNHPWLSSEEFYINDKYNINQYHFFTSAEMILLSKTHIDYRKATNEELTENFTYKNLITIDNRNNKNADTKSLILAPYNSVNSLNDKSLGEDCFLFEDNLHLENSILKFCRKAKEFNINYELNNNEEIDNGMLINSKYDMEANNNNNSWQIRQEKNDKQANSNCNSKAIHNKERSSCSLYRNSRKGKDMLSQSSNVFVVNESILKMVSDLGYRKDYVSKCLMNNVLCQATTIYYLLLNYENLK